MEPPSPRRSSASGDRAHEQSPAQVLLDEPGWTRIVADPARVARRAVAATGVRASVVLASDRTVRRLNARDRGRVRPTNVLTYPSRAGGLAGEIVLALGTVRREARAAGRPAAHHLAHLVVHGCLHLAGHDHHGAGEARRMELAEARLLHRMRLPNPWKAGQRPMRGAG